MRTRFERAIASFELRFLPTAWDSEAEKGIEELVSANGLFLLGESHGLAQNPSVVYTLMQKFGFRSLALEWDQNLRKVIDAFLEDGFLNFEAIAELWDGRVTAGHFVLLKRLKEEGLLENLILFDAGVDGWSWRGLIDKEKGAFWNQRDSIMARNLIDPYRENPRPTLVVAGSLHTLVEPIVLRGSNRSQMAKALAKDMPDVDSLHPMGEHCRREIVNVLPGRIHFPSHRGGVFTRLREGRHSEFFIHASGHYVFKLFRTDRGISPKPDGVNWTSDE